MTGELQQSPQDLSFSSNAAEKSAPKSSEGTRSSKPAAGRHIRVSSLHKRPFHHESYAISPVSERSPSHLPDDLELPLPSPTHAPSRASLQSETLWLCLYFLFNLSLTLYNKSVLIRFPFPYTLTALHALVGTVAGSFFADNRFFGPTGLTTRETTVLFAFSLLYTTNIVVSNISLQLVTVAVSGLPTSAILTSHTFRAVPSGCARCHADIHNHILVNLVRHAEQSFERSFACPCCSRSWASVRFTNFNHDPCSILSEHMAIIILHHGDSLSHCWERF
jgi:hypothetical protein